MFKYIVSLFTKKNRKSEITRSVKYSVKVYENAYKQLEKYDKKVITDAQVLAKSGRLRKYFQ